MKLSPLKLSEDCYEARVLMLRIGVEYELIPVDLRAETARADRETGDRDSSNDYRASNKDPKTTRG